jgi:hypothetical protein
MRLFVNRRRKLVVSDAGKTQELDAELRPRK